ncbi:MAG: FAD binding domain-containing protein [Eggerthellales bacterium]|nr:FAD binding domain-containing protein [Eggerthellales bacterium]
MKHFSHMDVSSFAEAAKNSTGKTAIIAGGTDLLGTLKDEILPTYPEKLINIKTVSDGAYITEDGDKVRIGALTRVQDVADSELIQTKFAALAQAAAKVASPTIRSMGTIGGNICQQHRCWYFRCADNRFNCLRKGGNYCPAHVGENQYHSIFGDQEGCYAVNSQETAPALIALGATIETTSRSIPAADFFAANGVRSNVLADDEIVTEIVLPNVEYKSAFSKFALRKAIDFAVVNCAVATGSDGKTAIVLGGVYPAPVRCTTAEAAVAGGISAETAAAAGDAAVESATPLANNAYKVEIARTVVKRTLLELTK